jgi:hypothetical protein
MRQNLPSLQPDSMISSVLFAQPFRSGQLSAAKAGKIAVDAPKRPLGVLPISPIKIAKNPRKNLLYEGTVPLRGL